MKVTTTKNIALQKEFPGYNGDFYKLKDIANVNSKQQTVNVADMHPVMMQKEMERVKSAAVYEKVFSSIDFCTVKDFENIVSVFEQAAFILSIIDDLLIYMFSDEDLASGDRYVKAEIGNKFALKLTLGGGMKFSTIPTTQEDDESSFEYSDENQNVAFVFHNCDVTIHSAFYTIKGLLRAVDEDEERHPVDILAATAAIADVLDSEEDFRSIADARFGIRESGLTE